jgi:hypothetical protein
MALLLGYGSGCQNQALNHHQRQNEALLLGLACLQEQGFALPMANAH